MTARRVGWVLAVAAIGTQISYPLASGTARDRVTIAVVVLLAAACVVHSVATRGARWSAAMLVVTAGGGLFVDAVGVATAVPFGSYSYATGRLGPSVVGVPLIVGLAWMAGAYPAWCAAEHVSGASRGRRLSLAAAGLAGWDLYLDPQMVTDGQWTWDPGFIALPGVPEVPLTNYLGWLLTAVVMVSVLGLVRDPRQHTYRPDSLPLTLYLWTWLGSALAHAVFLDLRPSALYGFLAMGVLGWPLLRHRHRRHADGGKPRRAEAASP